VILALATIGLGFLWMVYAIVGVFHAGHHEDFGLPMVVYYSPLFITGLWIVNLIVFLRDTDISIHDAAAKGNIEAVKKHLSDDANVNAKDDGGWTPLHRAAEAGQNEIVELLIDEGADVNAKMEDRWTPLDEAIAVNRTETADLLRKHGGKTGEELK